MPGWSSQNAARAAGRAWNSSRFAATTSGKSGRTRQARTIRHIPAFELLVQLERLLRFLVPVNDGADRLDHGNRVVGLECIASHVDARRALVDRLIGHRQGLELRQLLAPGDHDRYRAAGADALETLLHEIALHILR